MDPLCLMWVHSTFDHFAAGKPAPSNSSLKQGMPIACSTTQSAACSLLMMSELHADGRVDEVWTHAAAIFFTFVVVDEGEEFKGAAADLAFNAKDDTITGTMRYHQGDDLSFVWR